MSFSTGTFPDGMKTAKKISISEMETNTFYLIVDLYPYLNSPKYWKKYLLPGWTNSYIKKPF